MPKFKKIEKRGYIIAPKDPETAKNYDPETGIYSFESTGKDGQKYTREHVLFAVDITPKNSKYIKMETINLYPRNGYTFTAREKENFSPKKGYTVVLNKDPEELEERKPGEERKGYRNFYAKAIYANREADFQRLGQAYAKQGEEYRANRAAYQEKKAEERREKNAQKVADAISGLNEQETVTKQVTLENDPELEISVGYGNVLLQKFTAKDADGKEMTVRIPADINLQSGDTVNLNGIHQAEYSVEKTGKKKLYLTSLEKNTAELVTRSDNTRNPDEQMIAGMIGKPREFDGVYTIPLYAKELSEKEGKVVYEKDNEYLGRAAVSKDLYDAVKQQVEKGNYHIALNGVGKPVHSVGFDKKGKAYANTVIDLTGDAEKSVGINGMDKGEYLKSLQPKPEKKAEKAKAPKKAKTAKKTTERK